GGYALRKPGNTEPQRRQPNTRYRIRKRVAIGHAKHDRVEPRPADERLAAIAGRPKVHIVVRPAEHDVAVRRAAGRCSAVRSTEDDVLTGTAVDDVVPVQSKDHVIARPALDHVGTVERLVRRRPCLNTGVAGIVVIPSNEKLRPLGTVEERRLD